MSVKCVSNTGSLFRIRTRDLVNQIKDRPYSLKVFKIGTQFKEKEYK